MTSPLDIEKTSEAWIIYDGECPFCKNYVRLLRLKEVIDNVRLINARDDTKEAQLIREKGYDLDEGMIFFYNGHYHYGAEAIHMMAMLSGSSRFINRVNGFIFRSKSLSSVLYPFMRGGRNLTLKILGRRKISGDKF